MRAQPLAEGEVVTTLLEGALGIEKTSAEGPIKNKIALDLVPSGGRGTFMEFTCGPLPVTVSGSIVVPVKSNTMRSRANLMYSATSGRQKPEGFEGLPNDVLEARLGEAANEQAGLKLTTVENDEEETEINSVE